MIGLIITIGIILILVFGYWKLNGDKSPKNQIEAGQDAIDQAQNAANAQNQGTLYLQNEIADPPSVNFHGAVDKARDLK